MFYYVYLIKTLKGYQNKSYVGYTNNLQKRLTLHNSSKGAKFTKGKKWQYVYIKKYDTRSKAMKNEYLLKKDRKKRNNIKMNFIKY